MNKRNILIILFFLSVFLIPSSEGEILFFYSPHCKACLSVKNEIIPKIIKRYENKIKIIYLDTTQESNLKKLILLTQKYKRKGTYVPTILVGNELLVGKREIEQNIFSILDSLTFKKTITALPKAENKSITSYFKKISFIGIVSAGLIDGINPCAFTVILFFISFLALYGYKKRELIIIGSGYILAVLLSYILIGLGIFNFLYNKKEFYYFMKIFYISVALLCFILAILALHDCLRYRKTKNGSQQILQLPSKFKNIIRNVIGRQFRAKSSQRILISLLLIAFLVGIIVSLLEAVCTGQIYLPVIALVSKLSHLRLEAIFYLLVYNLMFIFPLGLIFILALWGINSQTFADFLKKRLTLIRLLMFFLFLSLGIIIILNL